MFEDNLDRLALEEAYDDPRIAKAIEFGAKAHQGQVRKSGEPFFCHPLAVAVILQQQGLSADTIIAGLLHDTVEDSDTTVEDVKAAFGKEIAELVDGLTKIVQLAPRGTPKREKAATYRKLLLASASDARVLVIKLADRLHNLRTIKSMKPARASAIAKETLEVYAPLAHRLGMSKIKEELEDRSLAVLDPRTYEEAGLIQIERQGVSGPLLEKFGHKVQDELRKAGIEAVVKTRVKSRYSISEKVRTRGKDINDIWDVLGMRVLVPERTDCYVALGVIHSLWIPRFDRFHDYIGVPKANLYQSLHTTVITDNGDPVEVQIRTHEMHEVAEYGIAAHWLYKETLSGGGPKATKDFLSETADEQNDAPTMEEAFESLKRDIFEDEVYIFTPEGDVKILALGSCAVDFAYAVHTDVGHHCVGARIDGVLKPILRPLKNGEVVEIITSATAEPSRDWIKKVATNRARSRIRQFHQAEVEKEQVEKGVKEIQIALKKAGLAPLAQKGRFTDAIVEAGYDSVEQAAIDAASDDSRVQLVVKRVIKSLTGPAKKTKPKPGPAPAPVVQNEFGVLVEGDGTILVRLAHCCTPEPGDDIIGYVSLNRGVAIHRKNCRNMATYITNDSLRIKEAEWADAAHNAFRTEIEIVYVNRPGLTGEIAKTIYDHGAEMMEMQLRSEGHTARGFVACQVISQEQSNELRTKLQNIKGSLKVARRGS